MRAALLRLSICLVLWFTALHGLAAPARSAPQSGTVTPSRHPLVARYTLPLPSGARARVAFGPDTTYGRTTSWQAARDGEASILVAGMRPSTSYHMRAEIELLDGRRWFDADHVFTTGAAPAGREPQLQTHRSGAAMASGVEMLELVAYDKSNRALNAVVTDLEGHLLWYFDHQTTAIAQPMRLLANGHMLMILVKYLTPDPDAVLQEVDLEGTVVRRLTTEDLNARLAAAGFHLKAYELHHEALELPDGHILVLVDSYRTLRDAERNKDVKVLGDAVVDLDPSWRPVWVWNGFDQLDLQRHPWGMEDWTHANAIVYDWRDGNLLVSLRHQSWVIKLDYQDGKGTGKVLWRLGFQGDFRLVGGVDADWFFGQHMPEIGASSTREVTDMAIFDNGNKRVPDPRGAAAASRVVRLRYDEVRRTAQILWERRLPWFSDASGGVCFLPQGHLEYTAGWLALGGHIGELDEKGVEVWNMVSTGQKMYRAQRIPSLYPGVTW